MASIRIVALSGHATIQFAVSELARYLEQIAHQQVELIDSLRPGSVRDVLRVGLAEHFLDSVLPAPKEGNAARFDDAIGIAVDAGVGVIIGSNPRSVLIAVYRYLHELGCRWVRPGQDGEYLPAVNLAQTQVHVAERPTYRHRGICIEGAVSFEHVRDLIDWMPKVGLNAYFTQFREAFAFFDRWYSHMGRPTQPGDATRFTVEQARELLWKVVLEAKQRDLLYHAVGHGWTCEPFGIAGLGWEYPPEPVPPDVVPYLALVNGKRELWDGIPLNTSLCFSNPVVRRVMTDAAVAYVQEHPEIDFLHFWLDDGANNMCECENCRTVRPADFYVILLNELDTKLSAHNLQVRVVFLAYFDLLWPPERERVRNPDRFVLMFAPITRTYSATFSTDHELPALPPYVRNQLSFPTSVAQNLAFLQAWQAQFVRADGQSVDSFDFDYHLMWDHYRDPATMQISTTLHSDLQLLQTIGLDGFISCQVQRVFFPTGLPMALLGWATWDATRDLETLTRDYFVAAFGPDGVLAQEYLVQLSALFDPPYIRGEQPRVNEQAAAALAQVAGVVAGFMPTIERHLQHAIACWSRSWYYLQQHGTIAICLADALRERALNRPAAARAAWDALKQQLWELEDDLHPVLDVYLMINVYNRLFKQE